MCHSTNQVKNLSNKEGFSFNALREINILLDLRHPNIVRVKEMVVGSDLHKVLKIQSHSLTYDLQ